LNCGSESCFVMHPQLKLTAVQIEIHKHPSPSNAQDCNNRTLSLQNMNMTIS
jgi:hypothetical protein